MKPKVTVSAAVDRSARFLLFAFVVGASMLLSTSASADCDRAGLRRSEALVQRGAAAREAGDFLEAVQHLQAAMDICSWGLPAFELAATYEQMGRPHDALTIYEDLLSGEPYGQVEGDAAQVTRAGVERTRPLVSYLDLSWSLEGYVIIRIDGEIEGETDEGSLRLRVNPGSHVVRAEADGHEPVERRVRVNEGATEPLRFGFAERAGRVVIRSERGTRIRLEGSEDRGELQLELAEGVYEAILVNEHGERTYEVEAVAGETTRYDLDGPSERTRRTWLWIVGGVLVVGAATTAAILLSRPSDPMIIPNPT